MTFKTMLALAERLTASEGGLSAYERVLYKVADGLPLDKVEVAIWRKATGRTGLSSFRRGYKPERASEVHLYAGRRGHKTTFGSVMSIVEGLRREVPEGQSWSILIVNPGLRQGQRIALDYIARRMKSDPELSKCLVGETLDTLTLSTGVVIRTLPPDPRLCQGFTSPLVWLDECSGFRGEDAFSNLEDVLDAARPSIATIEGARLLLTSLPGPKAGYLYQTWQERFDRPGALIFKASSLDMSPGLENSEELAKARKRPEHYALFYSGNFVDSVAALLPGDMVDRAIMAGKPELKKEEITGQGALGCDFAASRDDSAAALAFRTKDDKIVVAWVRNWTVKPGKLHEIWSYLSEIASACQYFGVYRGVGDQQSLAVAQQFLSEKGIAYERLITNGAGSEVVFDYLREALRGGRVLLPDNDLLRRELKALEESRERNYEVSAASGKDDLATAVAAAVFQAGKMPAYSEPIMQCVSLDENEGPFVDPYANLAPDDPGPDRWWHSIPSFGGSRR